MAWRSTIITWQQKNRADRRSERWRRTAWAFERTFNDNDDQAQLGWKMLYALVRSTLATKDDSDIVQVIAEHAALADTGQESEHDDDPRTAAGPRTP